MSQEKTNSHQALKKELSPNAKEGGICYQQFNLPSQGKPCDNCPVLDALDSGQTRRAITHSPDPSGHTRHALVTAVPIRRWDGEPWAAMEIITDITDQVELVNLAAGLEKELTQEQILEQAALGCAKILKADRCVIMRFDKDREQLEILRTYLHKVGGAEHIAGRKFTIRDSKKLRECLEKAEPLDVHDPAMNMDSKAIKLIGDRRKIKSMLFVPLVIDNSPWGLISIETINRYHEFSSQDKRICLVAAYIVGMALERAVLHEQAKLNAVMASIGRAAAILSHETANQITMNIGNVDFLIDKVSEHAAFCGAEWPELSKIQDTLSTLKEAMILIQEMFMDLDFFTYDRYPNPQRVDLNELVRKSLRLLERLAEENGIRFHIQCIAESELETDERFLSLAITNIVKNAIEAMPHGGQLYITIVHTDESMYPIQIAFRDTGPGIPPEEQEAIFSPFYTTKAQGTGLGLTIARESIRKLGGRLELESSSSEGSIFIIKLPLAIEEEGVNADN